jgi:polyisoprenyl-phosphate glycosyltransferase
LGEIVSVSLVIPVYNEEEVLLALYQRLLEVFETAGEEFEMIFVNDGSQDGSLALLAELRERDHRVGFIDLSRNFGHQIAITAGLDHAGGDAVVVMDADLQDPPEVVLEMLARWREGYDIVYGVRRAREGESLFKRATAAIFYRLLRMLTPVQMPLDSGDFRLMSRRAVKALGRLREKNRFIRGMASWVGYRQCGVTYDRCSRFAGTTRYPFHKMLRLAVDAVMSFSSVPLRLSIVLGGLVALLSSVYAAYVIYMKLTTGAAVLGWASLIVAVLGVGSVQLVCLGILGEYVARIYDEVRGRPLYLIREFIPPEKTGDQDFEEVQTLPLRTAASRT